jgi:uncharacterized phage protein (TIGR01671 family)
MSSIACSQWNEHFILHDDKDQYTGLKDKHGREIYEGDIVRTRQQAYVVRWNKVKAQYGFNKLGSATSMGAGALGLMLDYARRKQARFEVIGNIYKNPELLETD